MSKKDLGTKMMTAYCMLIATKGYDKFTVKDICETAGVSKMTFYRYFGSIGALEEEISKNLLSVLESFIDLLKETQLGTDIRDSLSKAEKMFDTFYPLYSPLATIKDKPPFLEDVEKLVNVKLKQTFMELSAFSDEDFYFLHAFLMGGGTTCVAEYAADPSKASPEHIAALIFRFIFYGFNGLFADKEKY